MKFKKYSEAKAWAKIQTRETRRKHRVEIAEWFNLETWEFEKVWTVVLSTK